MTKWLRLLPIFLVLAAACTTGPAISGGPAPAPTVAPALAPTTAPAPAATTVPVPTAVLPTPPAAATAVPAAPTTAPAAQGAQAAALATDLQRQVADLNRKVEDQAKQLTALQPTPTATSIPFVQKAGVGTFGVPDKPQGGVDLAKGIFKNQTGVLNFLLADPGCILFGPDAMDTTASGNPYAKNGRNPGAVEVYKAEGCIHFWDPVTESVPSWGDHASYNLPEGGFRTFSLGQGRIEIPRDSAASDPNMRFFALDLPYQKGNNYMVVLRGLYSKTNDLQQDTERNRTIKLTNYVEGHAWTAMYQAQLKTGAGFVSEEQIMQQAATSHASGNNCGAGGCSKLTLIGLDTNTGAYEVWDQMLGRDEALSDWRNAMKKWNKRFSNIS